MLSDTNSLPKQAVWKVLFAVIVIAYGLCYAPYGINETDGGFITGLAWQWLQGKTLYSEIVYVRPPLPVWWRAVEMMLIPDCWAVLGERWMFFLKVATYSYLGAGTLERGAARWPLALFGFIMSVHCYPPMAWHTVDGVLCAAFGVWCLFRLNNGWAAPMAAIAVFAATLCKQSFYPLPFVLLTLLYFDSNRRKAVRFACYFLLAYALFFTFMYFRGALGDYFRLTVGATTGGQALQRGVLDYLRLHPLLLGLSLPVAILVIRFFYTSKGRQITFWAWVGWLLALAVSYGWAVWTHQVFTVPFTQMRLLAWAGAGAVLLVPLQKRSAFLALAAVSWCAAISWGYNLPVMFSLPWVYAVAVITVRLNPYGEQHPNALGYLRFATLLALLLLFRLAYEFVYRDGRREAMNCELGTVFPKLNGIRSDRATCDLYADLKKLADRYPGFTVLPVFPMANFLTDTPPPLPLDWVVNREMNGDRASVQAVLEEKKPYLFIERSQIEKIERDPEMSLTKDCLDSGKVIEETPFFLVLKPE